MSKGCCKQIEGHEQLTSNPAGGFDWTRQAQRSAEGITPLDWRGDVLPYAQSSARRTADAACLRSGGMKALTYSTATPSLLVAPACFRRFATSSVLVLPSRYLA